MGRPLHGRANATHGTAPARTRARHGSALACRGGPACPPLYSHRNATIGSTSAPLIAGPDDAASAVTASAPATAVNVSGSVGVTSYSRLVITRVSASAATTPTKIP